MSENILFTTAIINREIRNRLFIRSWLYVICLLVLAMVIVGGATRLTDSGLSITEWKPVLGIIPPLSSADWLDEFSKYQLIPQYTQINQAMTLGEFKFIYWWEWAHRFLGRIVGFVFAIPLAYFWMTARIESRLKPRLIFLLVLGGLQGFIGWWMVKSGLVDRVDVSQYRLAVHLTLACIIFAYSLWLARGFASHSDQYSPLWIRLLAPIVILLLFLQIFAGGLVAGLDAGLSFNDWPLMDGSIWPTSLSVLDPQWKNLFENPKTVQFTHRMIAYFIFSILLLQMVFALRSDAGETHKRRTVLLFILVTIQALIGIVTLVMQVPLYWAIGHQIGAVVLLGFAVAHMRALKGSYPSETMIESRF